MKLMESSKGFCQILSEETKLLCLFLFHGLNKTNEQKQQQTNDTNITQLTISEKKKRQLPLGGSQLMQVDS